MKVPVAEAEAADAAQSTPEDVVDEAVTAMEVDGGQSLMSNLLWMKRQSNLECPSN